MFGFGASNNFDLALICRFFMGVAGAFGFLGAMRIATRWFPPRKLALASGCIVTVAMLGGIVAQAPMVFLTNLFGWRGASFTFGFLGIFILILIITLVKDYPRDYVAPKVTISELGFWKSIRMVLANPHNWLCGLYTTLMNLPLWVLGAMWGSLYLIQIEHMSCYQAALISSMLFFGTLIGSPLVGLISDKLRRRTLPMLIGAIVSLGIILTIMYVFHFTCPELIVLFFLLGLITSTQVISYPAVAELNSHLVTGSAISIVSMLLMLSGIICQPLFGWLMEVHWNHHLIHGTAVYAITDFRTALWMLPIGFIISIVLSLIIKETRCKSLVD